MLVSRAAAKLLWGDVDPIGRQARLPLESKTVVQTVVGVVGDIREDGLAENPVATVYEYTRERDWGRLALVAADVGAAARRSRRPPPAPSTRIDSEQPVEEIRTMEDVRDETLTSQRFSALLLGLFASVALDARVGRHLQRAVVHRPRPQPRDRHQDGARREAGGRASGWSSSRA